MEKSTNSLNPHDTIPIDLDEAPPGIRVENTNHSNSPSVAEVVQSHQRDFMHIVPANRSAELAFDTIARIIKNDLTWESHARKFVHINEDEVLIEDTIYTSDDSNDTAHSLLQKSVLCGHYHLNLTILPQQIARGWTIGSGRKSPERTPDLLISVNKDRDRIAGLHAVIYIDRDSHAVMIKPLSAKKSVLVNGRRVTESGRILSGGEVSISIGNLLYNVEFPDFDKEEYKHMLAVVVAGSEYFSRGENTDADELSQSIQSTPGEKTIQINDYFITMPKAAGGDGVVSQCFTTSGAVYAAKRVRRVRTSLSIVESEIDIMRSIGKHRFICSLVTTLYSDGDSRNLGESGINDVWMILDPWAPSTVAVLWGMSEEVIACVTHQCLQALKHLHGLNIIHRDIKVYNILLVRRNPIHVMLADFGHALFLGMTDQFHLRRELKSHTRGTTAYLPPEIKNLKQAYEENRRTSAEWSKASDIYSVALASIHLLYKTWQPSRTNTEEKLGKQSDFTRLISKMWSEKDVRRPLVEEILAEPLWSQVNSTPSNKRKLI